MNSSFVIPAPLIPVIPAPLIAVIPAPLIAVIPAVISGPLIAVIPAKAGIQGFQEGSPGALDSRLRA